MTRAFCLWRHRFRQWRALLQKSVLARLCWGCVGIRCCAPLHRPDGRRVGDLIPAELTVYPAIFSLSESTTRGSCAPSRGSPRQHAPNRGCRTSHIVDLPRKAASNGVNFLEDHPPIRIVNPLELLHGHRVQNL